MGLLTKKPPEQPLTPALAQSTTDPLREAANAKVEAAARFSKAMAEAGSAFDDLIEADRAYLSAHRELIGEPGPSSLNHYRLRWWITSEFELSAPGLMRFFDISRIAKGRCRRFADNIAEFVSGELSSLPKPKDTEQ